MATPSGMDRRRQRRVNLNMTIMLRRTAGSEGEVKEGVAKNVSLAGVYFTMAGWQPLRADEVITFSVSVPPENIRSFPFSRLAGRGRVVRVEDLAKTLEGNQALQGVALEFGQDLTVLAAAPSTNS